MDFKLNPLGIESCEVYLTHGLELGDTPNWSHPDGCYKEHKFELNNESNMLELNIPEDHLPSGTEFKIMMFGLNKEDAQKVFEQRKEAGVLVGNRFDYDDQHETFWLLLSDFAVVREGQWNQNNVIP